MDFKTYTKSDVYMKDAGLLKRYSPDLFKLTHMKYMRLPGFEERNAKPKTPRGKAGNTTKLGNSLSRSKARVFELALANPWEYFVTLTINPEWLDRYNLHASYSVISKWFNNTNQTRASPVRYLLVPEPHKDGAWHFHGLMMGLQESDLRLFGVTDNIPSHIKAMLRDKRHIYDWPAYSNRFGFVTMEPIRDHDRCAAYMTKYITKELGRSSIALNHHTHYNSHGLAKAEKLLSAPLLREIDDPDYSNDYVRTKYFTRAEDALSYFCDKEDLYGTINTDS